MELKEGTDVFTSTGEQVGKINRFVLNPANNEVTHVVVEKGWLLPDDKVIPMKMINSASEDRVILKAELGNFDELPPFEEKHYVELSEEILAAGYPAFRFSPSYYWYPPRGYIGYPEFGAEYYNWPPVETLRNIPADTVPLKEGAEVIGADGEPVGSVEQIFVDETSRRATHFVVSTGVLPKSQKLIPVHWLKSMEEDRVHLVVTSELVEHLPDHLP